MATAKYQIKAIPDFPGYKIDTEGKVWSCIKNVGNGRGNGFKSILTDKYNILTPSIRNRGYRHVILRKNGKSYTRLVHQLMAKVFIPNPNSFPFVLHIDDNPYNQALENLQWGTHKQNMQQAILNKRIPRGIDRWNFKVNNKQIGLIKILYSSFQWTQKKIGKLFNISQQHVSDLVNNKKRSIYEC